MNGLYVSTCYCFILWTPFPSKLFFDCYILSQHDSCSCMSQWMDLTLLTIVWPMWRSLLRGRWLMCAWCVPGSRWRRPGCPCRATTTSPRTTSWRHRSIEWGSAARIPALRTRCTTRNAPFWCSRNTGLWLRYTSSNERDQNNLSNTRWRYWQDIRSTLNVCLHLLRVYKYFRYSYIYSPLYLIDWSRTCQWFIYQWDLGKGFEYELL